jgi:glucose dehydrogenase
LVAGSKDQLIGITLFFDSKVATSVLSILFHLTCQTNSEADASRPQERISMPSFDGNYYTNANELPCIRAFDKDTGKILWQTKLLFSGNATPTVYMINGKQYVTISAGGSKSNRPSGGHIVAFAPPE